MQSFYSLYNEIVNASVFNKLDEKLADIRKFSDYDEHHLECLLRPDKQAPVMRLSDCQCTDEEKDDCKKECLFDAISNDKNGNINISGDNCTGCSACIKKCKASNLTDRKDILPIFELLNKSDAPVYVMIAPAFISQFSEEVSPGKLRSAFKKLGFAGMLEVALFADILTLKEALEFDRSIQDDNDFLLTSCCCPIWIAMIRKIYNLLIPHLPPSVSPMVACGRTIKKLYPEAKTVFVGPCVAKKAEAKEKDIMDAVDYVLTFNEVQDIFNIAEINTVELPEDLRDHSSTAGRIYARTGGVSEAVQSTLDMLRPNRSIPLKAKQANGVVECKALLEEIRNGKIDSNFLEGMGCVGGCVGGPKVILNKGEGTVHVNKYGREAAHQTPVDNPYVIELLQRLGFETVESLLENDRMFTRNFI
jgi:iron only hydrogenase large subunit-like protein